MKKLLLTVAILSICVNAALAGGPHNSGGGKPGTSGPKPTNGSSHSSGSGNSSQSKGNSTNKVKPVHKNHSGTWKSWSKSQYSNRLGCWLYWSADDSCWYRYDETTQTFVPCDELTTEILND